MEPSQEEMVLTLEVGGVPGELAADRSASLLEDLREVPGVRPATPAPQAVPPGAKTVELFAAGAAAVAVLPKVLPAVFQTVQAWINAQSEKQKLKIQVSDGKRTITLEYAADPLSPQQLDQLVASLTDKAFGRR